jgi:hypothetical protein
MVKDFQDYPEGNHGVGCIWTWRRIGTPEGPVRRLVPFCLDY